MFHCSSSSIEKSFQGFNPSCILPHVPADMRAWNHTLGRYCSAAFAIDQLAVYSIS